MRRVSLGHLVLEEGTVKVVEWSYFLEGRTMLAGMEALEDWNFFSNFRVSCRVDLNLAAIIEGLGLSVGDELSWVLVATSTATPLIEASSPCAVKDGIQEVSFELPSSSFGGVLRVELEMGLSEPPTRVSSPFSPSRVGHTVFRTSSRVVLEGDAGQLPILPVSFSNYGVKNPSSSLWWLRFMSTDLFYSANSALWMWLNTENNILLTMLDRPDSEVGATWLRFLKVDFVRQLLREALTHPGLSEAEEYPEGSLGALLMGVVRLVGPSLDEVKSRYAEDAGLVEANLQGLVNGGEI
ncbi:hypothetical protein ACFQ9D_12760 [Arthrobacter koreensis]|uniref:hypothetical protein n=1 Tax=Arthrobacter koreensis TaxID=199136 RepID=UPI0036377846